MQRAARRRRAPTRLVREAGAVQRREQEVARPVAGEHPAGAVAAVRGGREPDEQQPGAADRRSRAPAGPSTPRRGTRPASRARPARATRRAAGTRGTPTISAVSAARSRAGTGCEPTGAAPLPSGGARPAPRQRDRVVGDGPQAGDDPQAARRAARGRGRGDVAARPRDPARARGRQRRLRRRRGARGRRHAERGGRRPAAHRHRARAAPRRFDQRLRAHARLPDTTRSTPRTSCSARSARGATKRIGVGRANRRPFLFNTGIGFDAAVIRRVERYGELKRYLSHPLHIAAAFEAFFRARGHAHARRHRARHRRGHRRRALRDRLEDRPVHVPRPHPAARSRPTPASTGRSRSPRSGRSTPLTLLGGAASAMRTGRFLAHRTGVDHRHDLHRLIVRSGEPFAYQVDGDDVGRHRAARHRVRARRAHGRRSVALSAGPSAASATSGTLVMIASTPGVGERDDLVGLVDRPDVHAHVRLVRARRSSAGGARQRRVAIGVQPRVAVLGRERARPRPRPDRSSASRSRSRARARGTRRPRRGRTTTRSRRTGRSRGPRAARRPRARRRGRACRRRAPTGRHLISTLTSMPAHASSASASVGMSGCAAAQRGERLLDDQPEPVDVRVVVHDEHAVGGAAHVELHAVGARARAPRRRPRACSRARACDAPRWPSTSGRPCHDRPAYGATRTGTRSTMTARKSWSDPLPPQRFAR